MSKELKIGDVFKLEKGMKVYASLSNKFIYSNVRENSADANDLSQTDVEVGEVFKTTKNKFDSGRLVGEYVVADTAFDGGGTGHGPHDVYPSGHHVFAQKLADNGSYDPDGIQVDFYQSGCFTAMIEDVKVVRKMKRRFD